MTAREDKGNESYTKYGTVKTEKEMGTNTSKERNCTHHNITPVLESCPHDVGSPDAEQMEPGRSPCKNPVGEDNPRDQEANMKTLISKKAREAMCLKMDM